MMQQVNFFFKEKEQYDKVLRFEEGAKSLNTYWLPCIELTMPYTPLTWLMVYFITHYYHSDVKGFEAGSTDFWKRAQRAEIYLYECRVNRNGGEYKERILKNIVEIYKEIRAKGFNLAKPVPVTENRLGEIVPLKGAKRIAAMIALGVEKIPVREFDRTTLKNIPPHQEETSCINHSELIFRKMGDIATVKMLKILYDKYKRLTTDSTRKKKLDAVRAIKREENRQTFYDELLKKKQLFIPDLQDINSITTGPLFFLIRNEIELIEWLLLRRIRSSIVVVNHLLQKELERFAGGVNNEVTLNYAESGNEAVSVLKKKGCREFWCSEETAKRLRLKEKMKNETGQIQVKTYS